MNIVKNILMFIGGLVVVGALIGLITMGDAMKKAAKLDPKAMGLYMQMAEDVMNTGDAAASMVKFVKVEEDISIEDISDSLKSVALDHNMLVVGDTVMFRSGEKDTFGNDTRHVEIFSFCNKQIARKFIDYSKAFGAFMPCRVILIEEEDGSLWLGTMKLDLMIAGGYPLTPEMLEMAEHVRDTMYALINQAAKGDF